MLFASGRVVSAVAALLAIAACGAEAPRPTEEAAVNAALPPASAESVAAAPMPEQSEGVEPPSATLPGIDNAPGTETQGSEIASERVQGLWQVVDAAGPASGRDMIGRTLSFTESALGWIWADGKVEPGCSEPYFHVVVEAVHVRAFAPAFRAGWPKFRLPPDDVGAMHVWECEGAEEMFGPQEPAAGSAFFPVATDRLVMNWHNGTVLLLKRQGER